MIQHRSILIVLVTTVMCLQTTIIADDVSSLPAKTSLIQACHSDTAAEHARTGLSRLSAWLPDVRADLSSRSAGELSSVTNRVCLIVRDYPFGLCLASPGA